MAPRQKAFGSGKSYKCSAKQKTRSKGGMFTKGDDENEKDDTTTAQSVSISSIPTINCSEPGFGIHFAIPMEDGRIDKWQCYICASVHDFDLATHTFYDLCAQCGNCNPTQGWWGDSPQIINLNAPTDTFICTAWKKMPSLFHCGILWLSVGGDIATCQPALINSSIVLSTTCCVDKKTSRHG